MPIEVIQYRNQPILKITREDSYVKLQIGLKKAHLILGHIEAIREFLAKNSASKETMPENKPSEPQGNEIISNGI